MIWPNVDPDADPSLPCQATQVFRMSPNGPITDISVFKRPALLLAEKWHV
jgi:hypothetical protein